MLGLDAIAEAFDNDTPPPRYRFINLRAPAFWPTPMIDLYPAYKPFRNYMRRFAMMPSLLQLWAYFLHVADGDNLHPELVRSIPRTVNVREYLYPWDLEILVRETLLNAGERGRDDLGVWNNLARAVNHIRRLEDQPHKGDVDNAAIFTDLQRMAHRQFRWQSGATNSAAIIRAMKVFGNENLDAKVLQKTGMTMRQLLRLGMAVTGGFKRRPVQSLATDYSCIGVVPQVSRTFLERLTSSLTTLRERTRQCQHYDDVWLYSVNPLEHHPLVRFDPSQPDHLICPVPRYLLTRVTTGVFYDIVNSEGFANAYGDAFERYVGEVISKTLGPAEFRVIEERPYAETKARLKHGADWIVSDHSGHLFFECKTKRLSLGAKNLTDPEAVKKDFGVLARAIVQNYKNIIDAKKGVTAWRPDDRPVFPVVVTLEEWYLFSNHLTSQLREGVQQQLAQEALDPELVHAMPYFIASVAELENALQVVAACGIARVFSEKSSTDHREWGLVPFLQHRFPEELRRTRPLLFPDDAQRLLPEFDTGQSGDP